MSPEVFDFSAFRELNLTNRRLQIGLLVIAWLLVYPFIAYVIFPRPYDEVVLYYPTAKGILTHGEWLIPLAEGNAAIYTDGQPFLSKPPLALWFQAISMAIFGPTLFAARLPSTIFGLATALVVYELGSDLYDWRTGLTTGLVFLATPMISIHHHSATTADLDIYLVFFGTAFVSLVWQRYGTRRGMALAGIAGAGAVLAKSFAAGVFLFALTPLVLIRWRRYISKETVVGLFVGLAVLLPWPVYAYTTYPDRFFQYAIGNQLGRSSGAFGTSGSALLPTSNFPYFRLIFGHRDGLYNGYFIEQLAVRPGQTVAHLSIPILLALALLGLLLAYRRGLFVSSRDLFLSWWVLSVPLFFSLVGGNHDWYIQPMFAPLAILAAAGLVHIADEFDSHPSLPPLTNRQYLAVTYGVYFGIFLVWAILSDTATTPAAV